MSTILYAQLIRRREEIRSAVAMNDDPSKEKRLAALRDAQASENKLVATVAALIPAEVIALHAIVVSQTTDTADGVTTITKPGLLKWSLVVLFLLAAGLFVIARGLKKLKLGDLGRALIPAFAVVAWTGIIGTSALTPWVTGWDPAAVVIGASVMGLVLVAMSKAINAPE